jgi:hypothetical protein
MKMKTQILHLNKFFITTLLFFLGLTSEPVGAVSFTFSYNGASAKLDFPGSDFNTGTNDDDKLKSFPFLIDYSSTLKNFILTIDSKSPSVFESDIDQHIVIENTFWKGNINIAIEAGRTDVLTNISGSFRHTPGEFVLTPTGASVFVPKEDLPHKGDAVSGNPFSINFGEFSGADTDKSINEQEYGGEPSHPSVGDKDVYSNKLILNVNTGENEFKSFNYVLIGKHITSLKQPPDDPEDPPEEEEDPPEKPIPEPLTILGSVAALGFGAYAERKRKSSNSSEEDNTEDS